MKVFLLVFILSWYDEASTNDGLHNILRYKKHLPQVIIVSGGKKYNQKRTENLNFAFDQNNQGYFMKDAIETEANGQLQHRSYSTPASQYFVHQGSHGQLVNYPRLKREVTPSDSESKEASSSPDEPAERTEKQKDNVKKGDSKSTSDKPSDTDDNENEKQIEKQPKKQTKKQSKKQTKRESKSRSKVESKKPSRTKQSKKKSIPSRSRLMKTRQGKKNEKREQIITKATLDQHLTDDILKNVSTVLARRSINVAAKGPPPGVQTRRLITANDALIREYPYVVAILKGGEVWCAGALLNQRIVITTANCFWKSAGYSRMMVRACSNRADSGGQLVGIQRVLRHTGWNLLSWTPDNDIALVQLDRDLKFSHTCHAADLPRHYMKPNYNQAWVTGWGAESRDGVFVKGKPQTLQVYEAYCMSQKRCVRMMLRHGVNVTDNFLCLKQIGYRAPCTRDTGAPAISEGILWGLASWGLRKPCGTRRFPAMFTYLGSEEIQDFMVLATARLMGEVRNSPFMDRPRQAISSLSAVTVITDPYAPKKTGQDYGE